MDAGDRPQLTGAAPRPSAFDIEVGLLLEAVFLKYGYDFRRYSPPSLRRRVRSALDRFGCATVSALQEKVLHEEGFFSQLLDHLTIPTTEMFRDPGYFAAVRERVLPVLGTYPSFKVWIAGCSTGEEVWSMAILLAEAGLLPRALLYATDINPASLAAAKAGVYRADDLKRYARNYQRAGGARSLLDYCTVAYDRAVFDRALVRNVLFADHSLATDSVFSEVHFVSCRNVLIYFDRELQDRALGLFADSLCHRGWLGLGTKESVRFSRHADGFEEVVREERIYRKR